MSIKSLIMAGAIGLAGLSLTGCVDGYYYDTSGGYYGPYYGGNYGPYYSGPYYGGAIIYDNGYFDRPYYRHHYRHYRHHRHHRRDDRY